MKDRECLFPPAARRPDRIERQVENFPGQISDEHETEIGPQSGEPGKGRAIKARPLRIGCRAFQRSDRR